MDKDIFQYLIRVYLIYQASHKNISLQEVCLTESGKNSPSLEKYPEITYSVHDLIIKMPN